MLKRKDSGFSKENANNDDDEANTIKLKKPSENKNSNETNNNNNNNLNIQMNTKNEDVYITTQGTSNTKRKFKAKSKILNTEKSLDKASEGNKSSKTKEKALGAFSKQLENNTNNNNNNKNTTELNLLNQENTGVKHISKDDDKRESKANIGIFASLVRGSIIKTQDKEDNQIKDEVEALAVSEEGSFRSNEDEPDHEQSKVKAKAKNQVKAKNNNNNIFAGLLKNALDLGGGKQEAELKEKDKEDDADAEEQQGSAKAFKAGKAESNKAGLEGLEFEEDSSEPLKKKLEQVKTKKLTAYLEDLKYDIENLKKKVGQEEGNVEGSIESIAKLTNDIEAIKSEIKIHDKKLKILSAKYQEELVSSESAFESKTKGFLALNKKELVSESRENPSGKADNSKGSNSTPGTTSATSSIGTSNTPGTNSASATSAIKTTNLALTSDSKTSNLANFFRNPLHEDLMVVNQEENLNYLRNYELNEHNPRIINSEKLVFSQVVYQFYEQLKSVFVFREEELMLLQMQINESQKESLVTEQEENFNIHKRLSVRISLPVFDESDLVNSTSVVGSKSAKSAFTEIEHHVADSFFVIIVEYDRLFQVLRKLDVLDLKALACKSFSLNFNEFILVDSHCRIWPYDLVLYDFILEANQRKEHRKMRMFDFDPEITRALGFYVVKKSLVAKYNGLLFEKYILSCSEENQQSLFDNDSIWSSDFRLINFSEDKTPAAIKMSLKAQEYLYKILAFKELQAFRTVFFMRRRQVIIESCVKELFNVIEDPSFKNAFACDKHSDDQSNKDGKDGKDGGGTALVAKETFSIDKNSANKNKLSANPDNTSYNQTHGKQSSYYNQLLRKHKAVIEEKYSGLFNDLNIKIEDLFDKIREIAEMEKPERDKYLNNSDNEVDTKALELQDSKRLELIQFFLGRYALEEGEGLEDTEDSFVYINELYDYYLELEIHERSTRGVKAYDETNEDEQDNSKGSGKAYNNKANGNSAVDLEEQSRLGRDGLSSERAKLNEAQKSKAKSTSKGNNPELKGGGDTGLGSSDKSSLDQGNLNCDDNSKSSSNLLLPKKHSAANNTADIPWFIRILEIICIIVYILINNFIISGFSNQETLYSSKKNIKALFADFPSSKATFTRMTSNQYFFKDYLSNPLESLRNAGNCWERFLRLHTPGELEVWLFECLFDNSEVFQQSNTANITFKDLIIQVQSKTISPCFTVKKLNLTLPFFQSDAKDLNSQEYFLPYCFNTSFSTQSSLLDNPVKAELLNEYDMKVNRVDGKLYSNSFLDMAFQSQRILSDAEYFHVLSPRDFEYVNSNNNGNTTSGFLFPNDMKYLTKPVMFTSLSDIQKYFRFSGIKRNFDLRFYNPHADLSRGDNTNIEIDLTQPNTGDSANSSDISKPPSMMSSDSPDNADSSVKTEHSDIASTSSLKTQYNSIMQELFITLGVYLYNTQNNQLTAATNANAKNNQQTFIIDKQTSNVYVQINFLLNSNPGTVAVGKSSKNTPVSDSTATVNDLNYNDYSSIFFSFSTADNGDASTNIEQTTSRVYFLFNTRIQDTLLDLASLIAFVVLITISLVKSAYFSGVGSALADNFFILAFLVYKTIGFSYYFYTNVNGRRDLDSSQITNPENNSQKAFAYLNMVEFNVNLAYNENVKLIKAWEDLFLALHIMISMLPENYKVIIQVFFDKAYLRFLLIMLEMFLMISVISYYSLGMYFAEFSTYWMCMYSGIIYVLNLAQILTNKLHVPPAALTMQKLLFMVYFIYRLVFHGYTATVMLYSFSKNVKKRKYQSLKNRREEE